MREALARSDRDFASAPRRARARAIEMDDEETLADRLFGFVRTYPLEIAVAALLATAGGAITWNALALQTGRHPAPFFTRGRAPVPAPLPPARPLPDQFEVPALPAAPQPTINVPAAMSAPSAPVQHRPASRESIGDVIRAVEPPPLPVARPAPPAARPAPVVITPQAQQQPVAHPTRTSSIGDLIRLGDAPPIPPGFVGKVEPSRLVASGQRALVKLGYGPTKPDGIMGPGTRQAIEQFERDRRLPITGDFTPRTARALAAASGLAVE